MLWKAANEDTDVQQGHNSAQDIRSNKTGLLNDSAFRLLPHLNDLHITDAELIEKVNEATKLEDEQLVKRKKSTANKTSKELQTECQPNQTRFQSPTKSKE